MLGSSSRGGSVTDANFASQRPVTLAVFSFIFDYIAYPAERMDDDDDFLYGGPSELNSRPSTAAPKPIPLDTPQSSNGLSVAFLEEQAEKAAGGFEGQHIQEENDDEGEEMEDSEEDDIEFVMDVPNRSLDFRQGAARPAANRSASGTIPTQPKAPQPSLTTEYTPIQRGGVTPNASFTTPSASAPQVNAAPLSSGSLSAPSAILASTAQPSSEPAAVQDDGVDPSTLPPVTAPPSHPAIDPTATGVFDGRSILEVDLTAMADKPWRRPGSDISDWFNYGFDEISWEAYCYRRRDLGELANVLKTNVINFAGMPEDQLTALPPEVRTMVMTGATTMMNGAGPGMMGPGVMMDMSGMMGTMNMGMNGDMSMGGAMMQGMMQDGGQGQQQGVGIIQGSGTPEQGAGAVSMMQDGFNAGAAAGGMINMGMGGEYGMQEQNTMVQELYPNMQGSQTVTPAPGAGRATAQIPFRARGAPGLRGRGFPGRGRGRGGLYADGAPPPVPVRPASPLPPGVPTGPRNQNKYKDRDGNAPAVDGLDYGGGKESRRTPSGEPEERSSSRKRRSSPGLDDRGSKRR